MSATDDAWRKRVAARVEELDHVPDTSSIIDIVLTFSAEARREGISECVKECRSLEHGNGKHDGYYYVRGCNDCAEAIEQLASKEKS